MTAQNSTSKQDVLSFLAHQKLSDSAVRELVPGPFCTGRKSIWRRHCGWGAIGRRGTLFPHLRKMASDILWTQEERYEDGMWASCSYFASWKHLLAFRKKRQSAVRAIEPERWPHPKWSTVRPVRCQKTTGRGACDCNSGAHDHTTKAKPHSTVPPPLSFHLNHCMA